MFDKIIFLGSRPEKNFCGASSQTQILQVKETCIHVKGNSCMPKILWLGNSFIRVKRQTIIAQLAEHFTYLNKRLVCIFNPSGQHNHFLVPGLQTSKECRHLKLINCSDLPMVMITIIIVATCRWDSWSCGTNSQSTPSPTSPSTLMIGGDF